MRHRKSFFFMGVSSFFDTRESYNVDEDCIGFFSLLISASLHCEKSCGGMKLEFCYYRWALFTSVIKNVYSSWDRCARL